MQTKPKIKFIDIHTHILPGVDDGAQNLQEALALCRLAYEKGTQVIILTPHHRGQHKSDPAVLRVAYADLRRAVSKELPKLTLYLGNEIRLQEDIFQKITSGQVIPLCNSRYVLLEFPPIAFRTQVTTAVSQCLSAGKVPIIAHVERYDVFRHDPALTDDVIQMGGLIQLNADSIMGKWGFGVKRFCHRLLKEEKVHFVASDAHDIKRRPPNLLPCYRRVCRKYGEKYAKKLFWRNGHAIITNSIPDRF